MNEFAKFCTNVSYFLNRPLTTEDVLFDCMDGFDQGLYAEEVAETLKVSEQTRNVGTTQRLELA